jgi:hypothetical protein
MNRHTNLWYGSKISETEYRVLSLCITFFLNWYSGRCGVQLGPLGTAYTNRPIVPAPGDYDDGEIGGMIGRENRSTRRKPAPVPLCPPQIPHAARTRTRAAAVGSQRLTAWATAQPSLCIVTQLSKILNFFKVLFCVCKKTKLLWHDICIYLSVW